MKNSIQSTMLATLLMLALGTAASAVPISGLFLPDPTHCDGPNLSQDQLTQELGDGPASMPFPSTSEYWFPWRRCPHLSSLANLTTASPMTGSFGWSTWGHSLGKICILWPTTSVSSWAITTESYRT